MTDAPAVTDYTAVAERYLAAWNQTDPAARRRAVEAAFAPEARYVDPLTVAEGTDAIEATIAAAQAQFPNMTFQLTGPVEGHHQQLRFGWELGVPHQPAPVAGSDVALVDADGRLSTVFGFLDRVPSE